VRVIRLLVAVLAALALAGCGLPYIGSRMVTPERGIAVTDTAGAPVTDYELLVYRCTYPGSQFDRIVSVSTQSQPVARLSPASEVAVKRLGGAWVAPDSYAPYEPQPYWVACVNKAGFKSRRWSLDSTQGDVVNIVLTPSAEPGPDFCKSQVSECNACRSYEYSMYGTRRYRHSACGGEP
jgi:hypothetical protein